MVFFFPPVFSGGRLILQGWAIAPTWVPATARAASAFRSLFFSSNDGAQAMLGFRSAFGTARVQPVDKSDYYQSETKFHLETPHKKILLLPTSTEFSYYLNSIKFKKPAEVWFLFQLCSWYQYFIDLNCMGNKSTSPSSFFTAGPWGDCCRSSRREKPALVQCEGEVFRVKIISVQFISLLFVSQWDQSPHCTTPVQLSARASLNMSLQSG